MTKIDKELLIRYHIGKCTLAERMDVEQWMADDTPCPSTPLFHKEKETVIGDSIWGQISGEIQSVKTHRMLPFYSFAKWVAAILLPVLLLQLHQYTSCFDITEQIDNLANTNPLTLRVDDMEIQVGAHSRVTIHRTFFGNQRTLDFDGGISVANLSAKPKSLQIVTHNQWNHSSIAQDAVLLSTGQRYHAMVNTDYELVAATDDELENGLPIAVKAQLRQYFIL